MGAYSRRERTMLDSSCSARFRAQERGRFELSDSFLTVRRRLQQRTRARNAVCMSKAA